MFIKEKKKNYTKAFFKKVRGLKFCRFLTLVAILAHQCAKRPTPDVVVDWTETSGPLGSVLPALPVPPGPLVGSLT